MELGCVSQISSSGQFKQSDLILSMTEQIRKPIQMIIELILLYKENDLGAK